MDYRECAAAGGPHMVAGDEMMKRRAMEYRAAQTPARDLTVGEVIDKRIEETERALHALRDLKASLPGSFLLSGQSRIAALGWAR